ncbi:MAG: YDG domain-containing protein [Bacteroidales bacterium]|jgi:hypothetical protein
MKQKIFKKLLHVLMLTVFAISLSKAQVPASYEFSLRNDAQVSPTVFEFDIYLLNKDLVNVFELDLYQAGILVNPAIVNGGTITASIVAGSSQLVASQQPTTCVQFASNCIKLVNPGLVSHGFGTIISTASPGVRVARIRLTNTVSFGQFSPNLTFNFTSSPYNTAVYAYDQTSPYLGVNITNSIYFTVSNLANNVLNGPPVSLTITGANADNKTYDGTNAAVLNTGSATLVGVVGADVVNLISAGAIGAFADKNVGTAKTVTTSGFAIGGTSAWKYSLTQPTLTADITAAGLTVSGATVNSKVYDGTTAAALNTGSVGLAGVIGTDVVVLGSSGAVGNFTTKNIGNGKIVVMDGFTISGADASNYILMQPVSTANITAAGLTVSGATANNKVYDGTTAATLNTGSATIVAVLGTDVVSLICSDATGTFANKNVGTAKTVTVSGCTLSGADAGNYTLIQPSLTADITAKGLTVTANDIAKCFGTTVNFAGTEFLTSGLLTGDAVASASITSAGASSSAAVATYSIVPALAVGTGLSNYNIAYLNGTLTVNAIPATPVITLSMDTLKSDAPVGNQWYFNGSPIHGATGHTYIAQSNGNYYTIITINGCSSGNSNTINYIATGVNEISSDFQFETYPVPNDGQFTVSINTQTEKHFNIMIHDALGSIIFEEKNIVVENKLEHKIDITNSPAGIYFIIFRSNDEQVIRKIITCK